MTTWASVFSISLFLSCIPLLSASNIDCENNRGMKFVIFHLSNASTITNLFQFVMDSKLLRRNKGEEMSRYIRNHLLLMKHRHTFWGIKVGD